MTEEIKLRCFDMSRIGENKVSIFLGKRNSGKSFCVKDMLYYKKDIPIVRVISGTERANRHYGNFIPPAFIEYTFSDDIITAFMKRQQDLRAKSTDMRYQNMDRRAMLILDDLMFDKNSWVKNPNIKEIAMNGRHWDISFIITLQYCLGIPPDLRTNVDYVFLFKENRMAERIKIYKYWAGVIPTFKLFCEIMDRCTEEYGCLVIDNASRSNKIEDQVYYYRAQEHEAFKMCGSRAWTYSEQHNHSNSSNSSKKTKSQYKVILE